MVRRCGPRNDGMLFLFLVFLLPGCATVTNPATGRSESIFIDTPSEIALGRNVAASVERQFPISTNPYAIDRVQLIGRRLVTVADRRDVPYRFRVVETKDINALSTPGGNIYVFSGLVRGATDDELAAVLAHEMGHIAARHAVQQLQTALGYNAIMSVVLRRENAQKVSQASDLMFGLLQLGYSRAHELEADTLAVRATARAGFNPWGLVTFLEKLKAKEGEGSAAFLRTHPLFAERIDHARQEIARLNHLR